MRARASHRVCTFRGAVHGRERRGRQRNGERFYQYGRFAVRARAVDYAFHGARGGECGSARRRIRRGDAGLYRQHLRDDYRENRDACGTARADVRLLRDSACAGIFARSLRGIFRIAAVSARQGRRWKRLLQRLNDSETNVVKYEK